MNDLATLRYFYNLGIDYFRQNQFRMQPPPVPLDLEIGNEIGSKECSIHEGNDVRNLVEDLENKFNISPNSSTDHNAHSNKQTQRRTVESSIKNENFAAKRSNICSSKHIKQIPEQKNRRSKASQEYHTSGCNKTSERAPNVKNEIPNPQQVHIYPNDSISLYATSPNTTSPNDTSLNVILA